MKKFPGSFGVPNWQPTQPNVKQSMRCACAPVRCFSFSPTSAGLSELSRRTCIKGEPGLPFNSYLSRPFG